jgi:hypothetical protein
MISVPSAKVRIQYARTDLLFNIFTSCAGNRQREGNKGIRGCELFCTLELKVNFFLNFFSGHVSGGRDSIYERDSELRGDCTLRVAWAA